MHLNNWYHKDASVPNFNSKSNRLRITETECEIIAAASMSAIVIFKYALDSFVTLAINYVR